MNFDELVELTLVEDVQLSTDGVTLHYDAPAAVPDDVVAALRRHKAELIRWLSAAPGSAGVQSRHPPSYLQRRLLARHDEHPDPAVYNVRWKLDLAGPLDPVALSAALSAVVARHEALRTRFVRRCGHVVAEVMAPIPVPLPVHEDGDPVVAGIDRPFDPAAAPLLRACLVRHDDRRDYRRGERRWTLLLTLHHLACDQASVAIIMDELSALYAAADPLAEPVQYAEFARWERRTLAEPRGRDRLLGHWRAELAGAELRPPLPYDRPRPARRSGRGAEHRFTVGADLLHGLDETARRLRTTRYTVLCGAFALLLGQLTGQRDVVVMASGTSRTLPEHEKIVGFFAEALPLRVRIPERDGFAELTARLAATVFTALDHRPMPLGFLAADLEPAPVPGSPPLPTVLFTALGGEPPLPRFPGVTVTPVRPPPTGLARMELYLNMLQHEGELIGTVEYATDLFDATTIERWCDEYLRILGRIVGPRD